MSVSLCLSDQCVRGKILRCNKRDSFNKEFEVRWLLISFILGRTKGKRRGED